MKNALLTIIVLMIISGCQNNYSEKKEIELTLKSIFENFENPNIESFEKISTKEIYCIICFSEPNLTEKEPYLINQKQFFENFIQEINDFEGFKRAKISTDFIIVNKNNERSDITVYLTIWEKGEIAKNHEGAQLGIYLRKVNGKLKFAGIETIP